MKKKKKTKKLKDPGKEIIKEYISFGNKKKVFWSITLATGILSLIGLPIIIKNQTFLEYFLIIWILEIIYIWLYLCYKRKIK